MDDTNGLKETAHADAPVASSTLSVNVFHASVVDEAEAAKGIAHPKPARYGCKQGMHVRCRQRIARRVVKAIESCAIKTKQPTLPAEP